MQNRPPEIRHGNPIPWWDQYEPLQDISTDKIPDGSRSQTGLDPKRVQTPSGSRSQAVPSGAPASHRHPCRAPRLILPVIVQLEERGVRERHELVPVTLWHWGETSLKDERKFKDGQSDRHNETTTDAELVEGCCTLNWDGRVTCTYHLEGCTL